MVVTVTADDIAKGDRAIATRCPVALALQRETGRAWSVGWHVARTVRHGLSYRLPAAVESWLVELSEGKPMQPIHFELKA